MRYARLQWNFIGILVFTAAFTLGAGDRCVAFGMPPSKPLAQTIAQSQLIVVAKVANYTPDPNYAAPKASDRGYKLFEYMNTIAKPGRYAFDIESDIKGSHSGSLTLDLPLILSFYYGGVHFPAHPGQRVLLLLRKGPKGFAPVDETIPFVPLSNASYSRNGAAAKAAVLEWMIRSLSDPAIRQANTYLLQNVVDPAIVIGLSKYINDENPNVQDSVLFGMAMNQQVTAIPRIQTFAEKFSNTGMGVRCPMALDAYKTPEAVPYLNPLLFSVDYYTRLHAMYALDRLADQTSIPYFVLALRDPDDQHLIGQSAYGNLHRLIPALGPGQGNDFYETHKEKEQQTLFGWWADELGGKHGPKSEAAPPPQKSDSAALLFALDPQVRKAAAAHLEKSGDKASIPYLIVALQDPESAVSFSAITTLGRLIPELTIPRAPQDFIGRKDIYTQPVYSWWSDELSGKHQVTPSDHKP